MHTFLPYESYAETAKSLDSRRLNSGVNEALVILKSLARFYKLNRRGESGWENHTVAKLWIGHELQLGRFGLALAKEFLVRSTAVTGDKAAALTRRKLRYQTWVSMVEHMEELDFPDEPPSLLGDEEFHSAFRAWLLYKDAQSTTYRAWKRGEYPDHVSTRSLLPRKSSWKRDHYIAIWDFFGRPDGAWYSKLGWTEEPDDMRVFYSEDRIPQAQKEKQRKKDRPHLPFLKKKVANEQNISEEKTTTI